MKLPIITSLIGLIIALLLVAWVWAEPNSYSEITTMLEIPDCPYPSPANVSEAEANICYIIQNIKAILRENQKAIDKWNYIIRQEKQMARGE